MAKIKVTVNSLSQVSKMIDYWKDKEVDLEIKLKSTCTSKCVECKSPKKQNKTLIEELHVKVIVESNVDEIIKKLEKAISLSDDLASNC